MGDFNPQAFVAKTEAFDPNAFVAKAAAAEPTPSIQAPAPDVGQGETFANSGANALPLGKQLVDLLSTGVLGALRPSPGVKLTPKAVEEMKSQGLGTPKEQPGLLELYRKVRDDREARTAAGEDQNKWTGRLGKGVGTALSIAAPLPGINVGAGMSGRLISNGLTGLGYGSIGGLTGSKADLSKGEFGQAALDTAGGAGAGLGLGLAGGAGGELLAAVGRKVAPALQSFANRKALNALGAMKPELNALGSSAGQDLGQFARDSRVVTPFASKATMASRAKAGMSRNGPVTTSALRELDSLAAPGEQMDTRDAAERVAALAQSLRSRPALATTANKIETEAERIAAAPGPNGELLPGASRMSLADFEQNIARPYKQTTNWNTDLALPKETLKQLPGTLESAVEEKAGQIANRTGSDALKRYVAAKRDFGKYADLSDIAEEGLKRQASNHSFGLKDAILGGAGMAMGGAHSPTGGLISGALSIGGSKLANAYGDQLLASGAGSLANSLTSQAPGLAGRYAATALAPTASSRITPEMAALIAALRSHKRDEPALAMRSDQ